MARPPRSSAQADQLTDPGWEADPAVCQALPAYLRNALA
ncbi:hypothetical protein SHJG_1089 [Streptomyces hygroscopicus subsp. jinggangensis 5008]|nr:hypothetical protein SHJG_1089 [Streptomyces hygroscopicus subsp. jinggangensis 5008]AGF60589.1 hypothetical protein SHJGH_0923 [Streptomyces hygroscopicus subsp. jinggangensis TL01]